MTEDRLALLGIMIALLVFALVSLCGCESRFTETGGGADQQTAETGQCPGLHNGQVCCGGRAYERDLDRVCCTYGNDRVYVIKTRCHNGYAEDEPFEVCGSNKFDNRYQDCCAGRQPYDRQREKCCIGNGVSNVVAMGTTCCNGVPMEEGYLCCTTTFADTATKKLGPSHTQCCVSTDTKDVQTFDPKVEVCDTKTGRAQPLPKVPSRLLPRGPSRKDRKRDRPAAPRSRLLPRVPLGKDRKRDRPAARAPPSLPAPVHTERPLATDKNAPPFRYPRRPPKNFFVNDCLENGNEKEDGEDLQCCGSVPYRSSQKTCCKGILHDIPAKDSVCCYETAYRKNDSRNECLRLCRGKPFNTETQACCGGRVHRVKSGVDECCGDVLINTEKEHCCGGMALDRSRMSCCQDKWPFYPNLLRCNMVTDSLEPRTKQLRAQKLSSKLCNKSLERWGERWHSLSLPGSGWLHVEGRVERCGIRLTRHTITIPLRPAFIRVGGATVSHCMKRSRVQLVLSLPGDGNCLNKRQAARYLRDKTLDIFVSEDVLDCKGRKPTLRLRDGVAALLLMSRRMDTMLNSSIKLGS